MSKGLPRPLPPLRTKPAGARAAEAAPYLGVADGTVKSLSRSQETQRLKKLPVPVDRIQRNFRYQVSWR